MGLIHVGGVSTHIAIGTSSPNQIAQHGSMVLAIVVILNLGRPVVLASANKNLLGMGWHKPIERRGMIDLETLGERGSRSAGAGGRRAGIDRREGRHCASCCVGASEGEGDIARA